MHPTHLISEGGRGLTVSERYRGAANSTLYSALKMGPFMRELQGHIQAHIAGTNPVKYYHKPVSFLHKCAVAHTRLSFAHDGSIAPLLGLLQIDSVGRPVRRPIAWNADQP